MKKKKTKPGSELVPAAPEDGGEAGPSDAAAPSDLKQTLEGFVPKAPEDRRTDAEKRAAERMRKLEEERLKKLAQKSHRERVKEFNDHLAKLSEHHDIPKVSPSGGRQLQAHEGHAQRRLASGVNCGELGPMRATDALPCSCLSHSLVQYVPWLLSTHWCLRRSLPQSCAGSSARTLLSISLSVLQVGPG